MLHLLCPLEVDFHANALIGEMLQELVTVGFDLEEIVVLDDNIDEQRPQVLVDLIEPWVKRIVQN